MKILSKLLIFVLAVAVAAGIVIMCLVLTQDNSITVNLEKEGVTQKELEFSAGGMIPGESKEYTIQLNAKSAGTYFITLSFEGEEGVLNEILDVAVECEEYQASYKLSELLNGTTFEFTCDVSKKADVTISYTIPVETENEAQGATADFKVLLTAERQ